MHGGMPKVLDSFEEIRRIARPIFGVPEDGIVCELLWAGPSYDVKGKFLFYGTIFPFWRIYFAIFCISRLGIEQRARHQPRVR